MGEIASGILLAVAVIWLGPSFPFFVRLAASDVLVAVANLGIFFLVLMAGVEMQPREIAKSSKTSAAVAFGGMVLPLVTGFGLAWLFVPTRIRRQGHAGPAHDGAASDPEFPAQSRVAARCGLAL